MKIYLVFSGGGGDAKENALYLTLKDRNGNALLSFANQTSKTYPGNADWFSIFKNLRKKAKGK